MKKAICLVQDHPKLLQYVKEISSAHQRFCERKLFLERQKKHLEEQYKKIVNQLNLETKDGWAQLETYLKDQKIMPTIEKPYHFSIQDDVVFVEKYNNDSPTPIKNIVKSILDNLK